MSEETSLVVQRRKTFEQQLAKMAPRLGELLPARAGDPKRFVRMVGTAVLRNPDLLAPDVDRTSLVMALLTLAEMGLGPGPLAHLVAFRQGNKKVVVPIPNFQGLIDVALASGRVASFDAACVYTNDNFSYVKGTAPRLTHEPLFCKSEAERGAFVCAYSIAFPSNGGQPWVEMMQRHEIEAIRNGSKGYKYALDNKKDNPWCDGPGKPGEFRPATPSAAMAIKTVIRRQYKLLPKTSEMARLETVDNDAENMMTPPVVDESIAQILEIEAPPTEDKEERLRLLKKLVAIQQREPKRFAEACLEMQADPKAKLENWGLDGLAALEDALVTLSGEDRS